MSKQVTDMTGIEFGAYVTSQLRVNPFAATSAMIARALAPVPTKPASKPTPSAKPITTAGEPRWYGVACRSCGNGWIHKTSNHTFTGVKCRCGAVARRVG